MKLPSLLPPEVVQIIMYGACAQDTIRKLVEVSKVPKRGSIRDCFFARAKSDPELVNRFQGPDRT
jgi:hypothetical protein